MFQALKDSEFLTLSTMNTFEMSYEEFTKAHGIGQKARTFSVLTG
jgi:hypothetical protein